MMILRIVVCLSLLWGYVHPGHTKPESSSVQIMDNDEPFILQRIWDGIIKFMRIIFYQRWSTGSNENNDGSNLLRNMLGLSAGQPHIKDRGSYFRGKNTDGIMNNEEIWQYG